MSFTTRFAPSPTGPLHLGHAYSALLAYNCAQDAGGRFLLRIEDIDRSRARMEWETQIHTDLTWLGIAWEEPVMRQSERLEVYQAALDALWARGLLYTCTCTRADITAAVSAPQEGTPLLGPDGLIYPNTCRPRVPQSGARPTDAVLRLNMSAALDCIKDIRYHESCLSPHQGTVTITSDEILRTIGDIVLARRDMGTSYHLSVVLDDADQGVTDIMRGADLFEATAIHVVLQKLLDLPTPVYHHHRLIRDDTGKRLAKRDDARAIAHYRDQGMSPAHVKAMVGI